MALVSRGEHGIVKVLVAAGAAVALAVVGVLLARAQQWGPFEEADPQTRNVFAERAQHVDPLNRTRRAADQLRADGRADDADLLMRMAAVPSGIWLTPEQFPRGTVGEYVADLVATTEDRDEVPLLVLYGIPGRDCSGGFSAGGLDEESYRPWVQEVADALVAGDATAAVVVEPDALASAPECDVVDERVRLLGEAVDVLAKAGVTTYVDAGHSDWVSVRPMARMLEDVGIDRVRGFSTNVSNYQTDADELVFAERLSAALGGTHWITDRGRNGNGATEVWCNPDGRALGKLPGYVAGDSGLDAYLWIKPPAESDGTCNQGPPAGEVYLDMAVGLARAAGW